MTGYDSHNLIYIAIKYTIRCRIQMGPIRFVVCADSRIWSFFHPNVKHIYTVRIDPCPLYSALHAIHPTENTNSVNKWPISAAASVFIYSVGGGMLWILESIWLDKVWWEAEVQSDVIKIVDPYWRKWETASFECFYLVNANCIIVLEHTSL